MSQHLVLINNFEVEWKIREFKTKLEADLLGLRPEDVLSEKQIRGHLTDALNKFDERSF